MNVGGLCNRKSIQLTVENLAGFTKIHITNSNEIQISNIYEIQI